MQFSYISRANRRILSTSRGFASATTDASLCDLPCGAIDPLGGLRLLQQLQCLIQLIVRLRRSWRRGSSLRSSRRGRNRHRAMRGRRLQSKTIVFCHHHIRRHRFILDGVSIRRVILGDREKQHGAIGKRNLLLHRTGAERAIAHQLPRACCLSAQPPRFLPGPKFHDSPAPSAALP